MTTKLDAIRAREQAATPGPWEEDDNYYDGPYYSLRVSGNEDMDLFNGVGPDPYYCQNCKANAEFAAHSRADIPLLLAVAEAAVEMLAAQRANAAALTELRSNILEQEDILDGYRGHVNSRERYHAAKAALATAIAPLMAEEAE